jgi:glycerol kinase
MYARGIIVGLTRGSSRNHIIRAGLEALAYQTKDIIDAVTADGSIEVPELRVDGGAVANNLLCQFQADILGVPVIRPTIIEMTALGAAYLAGLGSGLWSSTDDISGQWGVDRRFEPVMSAERRDALYQGWLAAVELSRGWAKKVSV